MVDTHFERLNVAQIDLLLSTVETSFMYAAVFNADIELRSALSAAGYKAGGNGKLPDLLRQETRAVSESLKLIFRLYANERPQKRALAEQRLVRLVPAIMKTYVEIDKQAVRKEGGVHDHSDAGRVVKALTAIVKQVRSSFLLFAHNVISSCVYLYSLFVLFRILSKVLIGLQALDDDQFAKHIRWLYPILVDLVGCESSAFARLRSALCAMRRSRSRGRVAHSRSLARPSLSLPCSPAPSLPRSRALSRPLCLYAGELRCLLGELLRTRIAPMLGAR